MDDNDRLAERFEEHRDHLRAVALRLLGSVTEADDAVQESWFRLVRSDPDEIENLGGWLTTVVSRICLDVLRSRRARPEDAWGTALVDAEPAAPADHHGTGRPPEEEALLVDEVGLALLVVLSRLGPAERVAFVLHDLFAVPFERIAAIVDRSPVAAKKLASRARQRVRGTPAPVGADDPEQHRRVVEAFLAAARGGDLRGLVALLDPDVVRRADEALVATTGVPPVLRGAGAVVEETAGNAPRAVFARVMLVDGRVGLVVAPGGRVRLVMTFDLAGDRITAIDAIGDPERLARTELALLDPPDPAAA
ncbi:MAG TPA: sigma-70 family RNA polymerase sigma factor [Acidimicrobiales bacterium]